MRAEVPKSTSDLFRMNTVWPVSLTLSEEQFAAMEPHDQRGSPGGPSGGGRGPGRFLADALAPVFLQGRETASVQDFQALATKWFAEWDATRQGKLDAGEIGEGLSRLLPAPRPPGDDAVRRGGGMGSPPRGPMPSMDFPEVRGTVELDGETFHDVGIRYKGNASYMASRGQLKRSLKLDLNQFTKGQKLAGVSTLNLHSNVTDPGWMNEAISYWLYREAGVPASRTAYAAVSLTVPGQYDEKYVGLYSLVEQVNKTFIEERLGTREGALFKPEGAELFADLGDDWAKYEAAGYEPKTRLTTEDQARVIEFSRFAATADDAEFARRLGEFLEIDEFARYMAVTVWLATADSLLAMNHNYYLYLDGRTRKFQVWPWDLDLSFGKFGGGGAEMSVTKPWRGEKRFLARVFAVQEFQDLYQGYLREFGATIFQPDRIAAKVADLGRILHPFVAEESAEKLARFEKMVAGETTEPARPERSGPPGMDRGQPIVPFLRERQASISAQLGGQTVAETDREARPGGGSGGGFGPGRSLGAAFLAALDTDQDGSLTAEEFGEGMVRWFRAWNVDGSGVLTGEQLKAGITKTLAQPPGPPPLASATPARP